MARVRDLPHVFRTIGIFGFLKRIWQQIGEDQVFTWGAALAYSWMFAIFPFLIFLLSLVPLIPERFKVDVLVNVNHGVDQVLTGPASSAVKTQVEGVLGRNSASGFLSFGLLLTIWAASGGMSMTMYALDKAYDIEKGRKFWKHRLVAISMTLIVAALIILVLVLMPISSGIITWMARRGSIGGLSVFLLDLFRYTLAICLLFVVLAIIYHFGPSFRAKFRAITPGAVFTVVVWLLLSITFKIYLTKFGGATNYDKTYGAVAGAVILLLFFYIDAVVLLIGAEINSEVDFAVLGISSSVATPHEAMRSALPIDPEHQELARELQEKRNPTSPSPAPAPNASDQAT